MGSRRDPLGARRALVRLLIPGFVLGLAVAGDAVRPAAAQPAASASATPIAPAAAGSASASSSAASPPGPPPGPPPAAVRSAAGAVEPRIAAARELAARLKALAAGRLGVEHDPRALFDVDLEDEAAIAVEARRLRALVESAAPPPGPSAAPSSPQPPGGPAPSAPSSEGPLEALFEARLDVDRARLAFLGLPAAERRALLESHAARKAAADAEQPAVAAQREAQQKAYREAEEAAAERRRALEQMEAARTEALRLVARERARLLGVREAQSTFEATLLERDEALTARAERVLALRRRVEELLASQGPSGPAEASALYDELRAVLRNARGELAASLDELGDDASRVPLPGPDPLGELAADRSDLDQLRQELRERAVSLAAAERASRWARVRHFHEVVTSLNRDRHALYPLLPPSRRAALTGFAEEGREQARGEIDQLRLVVAYHVATVTRLVAGTSRAAIVDAVVSSTGLKLVALVALFAWWRRKAQRTLADWASRKAPPTTALGARLDRFRERALAVAVRVHRPLATLILLRLVLAILGPRVADLLEVRLLWIVLRWLLGGLVIVHAVDGLMAGRRGEIDAEAAPVVRLRSLRLVGLVAVVFGLILDLSAEIVGQGTINAWVLRTCWIALLPVAVVLVRWWRPIIFRRVGNRAKQSAVARWVAARPRGATGFVAATVGGVYLLLVGAGRLARGQMAAFDSTRRVLAYLFRREVLRTARPHESALAPIDPSAYAVFDPDVPVEAPLPGAGDEELGRCTASIDRTGGGVFAVVGERGSGKSTLARRLAADRPGTIVVRCPPGGLELLRPRLLQAVGLAAEASDAELVAHLRADGAPAAIVVDDAHRLVLPAVGGLAALDTLLALARSSAARCTWIVCFGAVMWQYVERARGVRPLFDDVLRTRAWTEEQIGELLQSRCAAAGIAPSFRGLYDERIVDESERGDLARRTEASYYRLLWDASGGNPGIALHFWRDALRVADDGEVVVSLFTAPDARDLQRLPADVVFVLRAVLRLERVALEDVARSTMVALSTVHDAIHFASSQGWVEERDGRYRVTWTWLRAVTVLLQRRHLLI